MPRTIQVTISDGAFLTLTEIKLKMEQESRQLGSDDMPYQADVVDAALRAANVDACVNDWRESHLAKETPRAN